MTTRLRGAVRVASLGLSCAVVACSTTARPSDQDQDPVEARDAGTSEADAGQPLPYGAPRRGSVLVHLFEWRFDDIARECEAHLGPDGVAAVQISPPNEHLLLRAGGFPWWQRYQPVSYQLESRSGTREQFASMIERCARAGVAIYVDAVLNHMSAQVGGVGSAGTRFSKYAYPDTYDEADFHRPTCAISDADYASDKERVQTCELLNLSDLNTSSEAVQDRLAAYLTDLVELGVRGLRIDAAKHVSVADLRAVFSKLRDAVGEDRLPFVYSEVFTHGGEAVTSEEYLELSDVLGDARATALEFRYTALGEAFVDRGDLRLDQLATFFSSPDLLPSERAVVFVDNHDTQRSGGVSYHDGALHDLAVITMLAAPYGMPSLMSSYAFDRTKGKDRGPPSDPNGVTDSPYAGDGCATERVPAPGRWVCEHRRPYVAGLIALRQAAAASSAPLTHFWSDARAFAFAREGVGFVAVNAGQDVLTQRFVTSLTEGAYCDVARGRSPSGGCMGAPIQVDRRGETSLDVGPGEAVVLFGRAK